MRRPAGADFQRGRLGLRGNGCRYLRSLVTGEVVGHPAEAEVVVGADLPFFAALEAAELGDGKPFHGAEPDGVGSAAVHGAELFEDQAYRQGVFAGGRVLAGGEQEMPHLVGGRAGTFGAATIN